jgi:hypothetical protein
MSAAYSAIIRAGKARPISNGSLIADLSAAIGGSTDLEFPTRHI